MENDNVETPKIYETSNRRRDSKATRRVCLEFLSGLCTKDSQCRFLHSRAEYERRLKRLSGFNADIAIDDSSYWQLPTSPKLSELTEKERTDFDPEICHEQSKDKMCGICLEIVLDKNNIEERRFGIQGNCKHIFCLSCLRQWRDKVDGHETLTKTCPECRTYSAIIYPSAFYVEKKQVKDKLIHDYRIACQEAFYIKTENYVLDYLKQNAII